MRVELSVKECLTEYPLIAKNKDTVGGQFRIAGTRLPASHILRSICEYGNVLDVANNYELVSAQIVACLELAADILENLE